MSIEIGQIATKKSVSCSVCGCTTKRNIKVKVYENTPDVIEAAKELAAKRANAPYTCRVCKQITKDVEEVQEVKEDTTQDENSPIFYSNSSINGKYLVMTTQVFSGKGVLLVGSNNPLTHKSKNYFGLTKYAVSKEVLETIIANENSEVAYF